MIKPILKIEIPSTVSREDWLHAEEMLSKKSDLQAEYHVLLLYSPTEYTSVEIITASDISIHKP
jgi:hypothetical protein